MAPSVPSSPSAASAPSTTCAVNNEMAIPKPFIHRRRRHHRRQLNSCGPRYDAAPEKSPAYGFPVPSFATPGFDETGSRCVANVPPRATNSSASKNSVVKARGSHVRVPLQKSKDLMSIGPGYFEPLSSIDEAGPGLLGPTPTACLSANVFVNDQRGPFSRATPGDVRSVAPAASAPSSAVDPIRDSGMALVPYSLNNLLQFPTYAPNSDNSKTMPPSMLARGFLNSDFASGKDRRSHSRRYSPPKDNDLANVPLIEILEPGSAEKSHRKTGKDTLVEETAAEEPSDGEAPEQHSSPAVGDFYNDTAATAKIINDQLQLTVAASPLSSHMHLLILLLMLANTQFIEMARSFKFLLFLRKKSLQDLLVLLSRGSRLLCTLIYWVNARLIFCC